MCLDVSGIACLSNACLDYVVSGLSIQDQCVLQGILKAALCGFQSFARLSGQIKPDGAQINCGQLKLRRIVGIDKIQAIGRRGDPGLGAILHGQ